mmetsp:Transcript_13110/g.11187  ORF Transcript_13110/g.11187 Transcript_13110/m.11187 type:complete len:97 (-) Transcript_13110:299-589(-)
MMTKIEQYLKGRNDIKVDFFDSRDKEKLQKVIDECNNNKEKAVGVCGGDGTIGVVLDQIHELTQHQFQNVPIIFFPGGTGNDFYSTLRFKALENVQ